MDNIKIGLIGESTTTVTPELTARHLGSGGINVYATPAMILLMEGAAVSAIDPLLSDGQASVGVSVSVKHLAATPMGKQVRAQAEVTEVVGRHISFNVKAWDERELIGEGTHVRFVVDLTRYLQRLNDKMK